MRFQMSDGWSAAASAEAGSTFQIRDRLRRHPQSKTRLLTDHFNRPAHLLFPPFSRSDNGVDYRVMAKEPLHYEDREFQ